MIADIAQQVAITAPKGVLRILAGPGSGKTFVVTNRIQHFIEKENIPPSCILVVSFSVRAAQEIKDRLKNYCCDVFELIEVKTLHALARMICLEGGFPYRLTTSPHIIQKAIKQALLSCQKDPSFPNEYQDTEYALSLIEHIKQCEPHVLLDSPHRHDIQLCQAFDNALRKQGYCTFQDLGPMALDILHKDQKLCAQLKNKYLAVLVDEAQDLNPIQFELIQKLLPLHPNLTIVGDDDQGIYSWRGADPDALRLLPLQYPHTQTCFLTKNYRCPPDVVEASAQLISHNQHRYHKSLVANKTKGKRIKFHCYESFIHEVQEIAIQIETLLNQKIQPDNIAVLCRNNSQCNQMAIMLQAKQIPVFHSNHLTAPQSEAFVSLLKVLHQGIESPVCCDIFQLGSKKISKTLVQSILPKRISREEIPSFLIHEFKQNPDSPVSIILSTFFTPIQTAREEIKQKPLQVVLQKLFQELDLIQNEEEEEIHSTIAREILSLSAHFAHSIIPLPSLIAEIETRQHGIINKKNTVHVITIHKAKGLEFDHVFVPAVQAGTFPPKIALYNNSLLEEERRLCYVAMTRAKLQLYMSNHRSESITSWSGFLAESRGQPSFTEDLEIFSI